MVSIVGKITKSDGSTVLGGNVRIRATLRSVLVIASTTPDTIAIPDSVFLAVNTTTGLITGDLPATQDTGITYSFVIEKEVVVGTWQAVVEYPSFEAVVPNASPAEFAQMLKTGVNAGMVNLTAYQIKELLLNDPAAIAVLSSKLLWRGQWVIGTTYNLNDAVWFGGSSYAWSSTTSQAGVQPNPNGSTAWFPIALKGDPGGAGGIDSSFNQSEWAADNLYPATRRRVLDAIATLATAPNLSGYALLAAANQAFTGINLVPTPGANPDAAQIAPVGWADSRFVRNIINTWNATQTFLGRALVPNRNAGDNGGDAANTAFVQAAIAGASLSLNMKDAAIFEQRLNQNIAAGGSVANTANVRALNTTTQSQSWASRSSSTIFLNAGTYCFYGEACASGISGHRVFIVQTTPSPARLVQGRSHNTVGTLISDAQAPNDWANCGISEPRVITGTQEFQLWHWTQEARSGNGLGKPSNENGQQEVYAKMIIWKVA